MRKGETVLDGVKADRDGRYKIHMDMFCLGFQPDLISKAEIFQRIKDMQLLLQQFRGYIVGVGIVDSQLPFSALLNSWFLHIIETAPLL